jgi:hypothetical protein
MDEEGPPEPSESRTFLEGMLVAACATGAIGALVGDALFGLVGAVLGFIILGAIGILTLTVLNKGAGYVVKHEREVVQGLIVCALTMLILETIILYVRRG